MFQEPLFYDPKRVSDVRWNFEVFLINKQGYPVYRFSEDTPVKDIGDAVKGLLQEGVAEKTKERDIELLCISTEC